jgi:MYXO-CTERM domain-containing protein
MSILRSGVLIAVVCVAGAGSATALPIGLNAQQHGVEPPEAAPVADGTCPGGYYPCGDSYCTPDGGVCCASAGHPELYCPSGTSCTTDGNCVDDSGGGGGGGTCDAGYYPCGDSYCTPEGGVCCASAGHPELYCPSGSSCTTDGSCVSDGGDGGDQAGFTCSDVTDAGDCVVQFCLNIDTCQGYYVVDGVQIDCASCNDIEACAADAADYCADGGGSGDYGDDDAGGCRVAPNGTGLPLALALGALVALGTARRRRRPRHG